MTTGTLCRLADITPHQLRGLLLSRKVAPPPKDESGRFRWPDDGETVETIRRAASVDLRRRENRQPQPA